MRFVRPVLILFVAILALMLGISRAGAHAQLESSTPAADALLTSPPSEIVLTFTEPVDLGSLTVTVVDESGQPVSVGAPRLDSGNDRRVIVPADGVVVGAYTVSWANRSATDGHTLSGSFAFRIGGTDRAPAAATVEGQRPPAWAVVTRWLTFLGAAFAIGGLIGTVDDRRRRLIQMGLAVALLATLAEPVLLSAFPPEGSIGGSIGAALRAEPDGWWVRLAGLAIALSLTAISIAVRYRREVIGAAALVGIAGLSLTSHAAGRESFAWAAVGVTFIHNAAVALWMGALGLITIAPLADRWAELRQFARAALPLAAVAVVAGVLNAGLILPSVSSSTESDYGWVLVAKVSIVLGVFGLAGLHHLTLRRDLTSVPSLMRRSIRLELGLIALAVAFASTLALLSPPQESRGDLDKVELAMPTSPELTEDQVYVRLDFDPARTGENTLTAYATDGPPLTVETDASGAPVVLNHPALTDVQLMRVELSSLDRAIAPRTAEMTQIGDGRFVSEGVNFSADGWWRALVTVRREGAPEDLTAEFFLRTPDPNVFGFGRHDDASDTEARELFEQTRAGFSAEPWVFYRQHLTGGDGGVEINTLLYANGGIEIATPNLRMIRIDGQRYLTEVNGEWRAPTQDSPPVGPAEWRREFDGATDFVLGNAGEVNGAVCQVVTFYVPGVNLAPAYYAWWINVETGQLEQESMVSRSHYMIKYYDWSTEPARVEAPR